MEISAISGLGRTMRRKHVSRMTLHGPFIMSQVTAGHELDSEAGVCKNSKSAQR